MFQCSSLKSSHLPLLQQSPKFCSLHLCLFCCLAYRVIITIFLNLVYMCVIILYWCFSFWLTSLCIIGSNFIHLIRTKSNAFFLIAEEYSIVHMCHSFLIHSSADGHLLHWKVKFYHWTMREVPGEKLLKDEGGERQSGQGASDACLTPMREAKEERASYDNIVLRMPWPVPGASHAGVMVQLWSPLPCCCLETSWVILVNASRLIQRYGHQNYHPQQFSWEQNHVPHIQH